MVRVALLCAVALLAAGYACGQDDNSIIHISQPIEIAGSYRHSEALFGRPSYGGAITGVLVYAANRTGCDPITPSESWPEDPILLLDRGGCKFVQKVRNAEAAGAQAVLIADNKPLCGPTSEGGSPQCSSCTDCAYTNDGCECRLPYLADDGSGGNIQIPSALISLYDSQRVKACMQGNAPCTTKQPVVITFEWSLPTTAGAVEWDLWSISNDANSEMFREAFAPFVPRLGASVKFTPHYFIYNGRNWGCTLPWGNNGYRCGNQCTNAGRYCAPDPERNLTVGLAGRDMVKENLRQICIFRQANETYAEDYAMRWWKYVELFGKNCVGELFASDECSWNQQLDAGLIPQQTNECMEASGGLGDHTDNTILKNELELREDLSIVTLPTVIVNGIIERGAATSVAVLRTICAGFKFGTQPKMCTCLELERAQLDDCISGGSSGSGSGTKIVEEGMPGWAVALLVICLLLFVVVVIVVAFVLYQRERARMRDEMRDIIGEYMQLGGGEEEGGPPTRSNPMHDDDAAGAAGSGGDIAMQPLNK